jgi:hypothetical protein
MKRLTDGVFVETGLKGADHGVAVTSVGGAVTTIYTAVMANVILRAILAKGPVFASVEYRQVLASD